MSWPTDVWHIRRNRCDYYVFLSFSLEIPAFAELVPPRDAALEVGEWASDPRTHDTLHDIYRALFDPGMLSTLPRQEVPIGVLADRLRLGFLARELVLVVVPLSALVPPPIPIPIPIPIPPKEKTWIRIRVVHADGTPVTGRRYILELPGGGERSGTLLERWDPETQGSDNTIEERGIDPGSCSIEFPWTAEPVEPGERPSRGGTETLPENRRAYWADSARRAKMGESREMVVEGQALSDGEEALFVVTQEGYGEVGRTTSSVSQGKAAASFEDWYAVERVTRTVKLEAGQEFPTVSFSFTATVSGVEVAAEAPLPYGDDLRVELRSLEGARLADRDYTLQSPWGTRTGKTDGEGILVEKNLPPGGASVLVGQYRLQGTQETSGSGGGGGGPSGGEGEASS